MFKAELIVFQIVKHHADDTHNLFFVEVIENFRDMLNNVKLEVSERIHSKVMVSQDPQRAAHVVSDLSIFNTLLLKHLVEDGHSSSVDELPGKLVFLEDKHETVTKGFTRKGSSVVFMFKKVVEEVFRDLEMCRCFFNVVTVVNSFDKNCKNMCGKITLMLSVVFCCSNEEAL